MNEVINYMNYIKLNETLNCHFCFYVHSLCRSEWVRDILCMCQVL